jgi:SPP1 family phage portal protein
MIYRIPYDTEMSKELLSKYIAEHKDYVRQYAQPLANAYKNKYEIFDLPKKMDGKPDNRIAVNYAKYITDTFNGFFCGIPVKVTTEDENTEAYIDYLNKTNDGDNLNAEVSKLADICGSSWEMYYNKEDGETGITYLSDTEAFMLVDDSILERPMYFVRFYLGSDGMEYGSYSDSKIVRHFWYEGGEYHFENDEHIHGFGYVPAVEYLSNDERMGLFESALPAINAYNKALSEKANDVDYFADAYLKVIGASVDDDDTFHIRRTRVVNFDGDTSEGNYPIVEFMEKPSSDETQEHLLERLQNDIFITSMVANISDENFGTASGIALRYKLEAMQNLFTAKARRFTSSMLERYKIIFSSPVAQMHGVSKDAWSDIEVKFTANYPANLESEAEVAKNLEGVVSKETQLKVLSIVDNVAEETERLDAEQMPSVTDNIFEV